MFEAAVAVFDPGCCLADLSLSHVAGGQLLLLLRRLFCLPAGERQCAVVRAAILANSNLVAQLGAILGREFLKIEVDRLLDGTRPLLFAQIDRNCREFLRLFLIAFL